MKTLKSRLLRSSGIFRQQLEFYIRVSSGRNAELDKPISENIFTSHLSPQGPSSRSTLYFDSGASVEQDW